ncbi:MAG: glycosyltransferase [Armatimonadetes bacterium]|nr:glycosyltransferase [Armatimonadota bacterium]
MGGTAVNIVLNDAVGDRRVLRAADLGATVLGGAWVFALHAPGLPVHETWGRVRILRFALRSRSWGRALPLRALKYAEASIRMVASAVQLRPSIVHAHDLNALPIGLSVARLARCPLVYDAHELWSDPAGDLFRSRAVRLVAKALEGPLVRQADHTVTVCKSIADVMQHDLGIAQPSVIRNIPRFDPDLSAPLRGPLRTALGLAANVPILLYQGVVSRGNGVEHLVAAMPALARFGAVLVLLGDGPDTDGIAIAANRLGVGASVMTHPYVSPEQLPMWTRDATIGLSFPQVICNSYRLSLPNKLFEYIHAGVPIVSADLPEARSLLQRYGVGVLVAPGDQVGLERALAGLLTDKVAYARYSEACNVAAHELTWTREESLLKAIYDQLLSGRSSSVQCR